MTSPARKLNDDGLAVPRKTEALALEERRNRLEAGSERARPLLLSIFHGIPTQRSAIGKLLLRELKNRTRRPDLGRVNHKQQNHHFGG